MTIFASTRYFEEERAPIGRRRGRRRSRAPRAAAAELTAWSGRGTGFDRGDREILGAVAGTAAILLVKISMVWVALQAI